MLENLAQMFIVLFVCSVSSTNYRHTDEYTFDRLYDSPISRVLVFTDCMASKYRYSCMHSCKYFAAKELSAQLIPTYSPAFFPSLYLYIRYDEIFGAAKPLKSEARPPNFFSSFQPRQIPRNAPATRGSILSDLTSYASFSRRYRSINTFFSHRSGMLTMSRINACIYK